MNRKVIFTLIGLILIMVMGSCVPLWKDTPPTPAHTETDAPGVEELEPTATTAPATVTPLPTETLTATITDTPEPLAPVFSSPVIYQFTMFTPHQGWAVTQDENYLLRTEDGGQTWLDVTPAGLHPIPDGYISLSIRPFFLDENTAWFTPNVPGSLYHTQDAGATWTVITVPFDRASYYFLDLNTGYGMVDLGAGAGSFYLAIYRTLDGGSTSTQVFTHEPGESKSLPEGGSKNGITFRDVDHGWVGGSKPMDDFFYLYYTEDGGTTWAQETDISLPAVYEGGMLDVWQPIFVGAASAYLPVFGMYPDSTYLLIYRSDDYGLTWTFQNAIEDGLAVDFVTPNEGWIVSSQDLFHTLDGGVSWSIVSGSGIPTGEQFISVDFVDSTHGWVMATPDTFTLTPLELYRTEDGGLTWTQLLP